MKEILTIRLASEEKIRLQQQAAEKGFRSNSDFARHLLGKGLEAIELRKSEYHLLAHTTQTVMLLRTILSTISSDEDVSKKLIEEIKNDATNWVEKFSKSIVHT